MIDVRGFIETSFLDWDGKITSVIFVPNCDFRCPYCSNSSLIKKIESLPPLDLEIIDEFLIKRQNFIDGVVITGGEPTLQPDLPNYIRHLKSLGFLIKLDTNGSNPQMLKNLLSGKLLDYMAMDIKAPLDERYYKVAAAQVDLNKIKESIRILLDSDIDYEFRTTICPAFLSEKDIEDIARAISGAKKYVLQQFVPKDTLDPEFEKIKPYPKEKLMTIAELCQKYVKTQLRGV
jgi:pyruvate formate lyase activating enzyme